MILFFLVLCGLPSSPPSGLPLPKPDQTEEMLVEAMLKVVNLPGATVRTAVRLPVKSKVRKELKTPKSRP